MPTVERKLRTALLLFAGISKEFIPLDSTIAEGMETEDYEYYLTMMSSFISEHFEIDADAETIRQIATLGELVNFVNARSYT